MKKLSDIFKSITSVLTKPFADIKYRNITEESVRAQIEDTRWGITSVAEAYSALSDKQLNKIFVIVEHRLKFEPNVVKSAHHIDLFINQIPKELKGRAKSLGFFKSLDMTSKQLLKLLDKMDEHVPMLVTGKEGILINDMQISHAVFFGMLETIKAYYTINSYLLAIFSHIATMPKQGNTAIARYMVDYIFKHQELFFDTIDQMCNQNGDLLMTQVANIKKQGMDFRLTAPNAMTNRLATTTIVVLSLSTFVASFLAIPYIGEKYVEFRYKWFEYLKEQKKWLEHHVANLKLAAEDTDPNDPEYVKLQKIIMYYDDKIAELDKKIQKFYEE